MTSWHHIRMWHYDAVFLYKTVNMLSRGPPNLLSCLFERQKIRWMNKLTLYDPAKCRKKHQKSQKFLITKAEAERLKLFIIPTKLNAMLTFQNSELIKFTNQQQKVDISANANSKRLPTLGQKANVKTKNFFWNVWNFFFDQFFFDLFRFRFLSMWTELQKSWTNKFTNWQY